MRIGITGASGYVGSRVARIFRKTEHEIWELGRSRTHYSQDNYIAFSLQNEINQQQLAPLDVIINFAYDFEPVNWDAIKDINVDGTIDFFETVEATDTNLIHISSLSAFEGCQSKYGRAKFKTEQAALQRGFTVVRPGLIYGPDLGGLLESLSTLVEKSPVVGIPAGGPYIHYLCHYADLALLLIQCCECIPDAPNRPLVAASDTGLSFREILHTLADARNTSVQVIPVPVAIPFYFLHLIEYLGIPTELRSDSITGLVHPHPNPDFRLPESIDISFRDFSEK
jgi:NADH dehydrogenase